MRSINSNILAEIAKTQYTVFHGLRMTIDSVDYLYSTADVPISVSGNLFLPRAFEIKNLSYSQANIVTRTSIVVDNLDDVMSSLFVGSVVQGSPVEIHSIIWFASSAPLSVITFQGEIDDWTLDEEHLSITVASVFQRWNQRTVSKYSPSCRWKAFKGTECGYSGEETVCDRSYQRCVGLGNQINFGGFRWLPSIIDKPIWWGKKPEV